ncbi:MAG: methylated-DNA--[protein]-cysteine S-methyltransferase [Lachnospiraceae bacterium]|nr:methylated-DNA--[protein]-cysteine S-methyltransferase [Lachnospiraceae bacterium]
MENRYVFQSSIGMLKICEENGSLTRLCLQQEDMGGVPTQNFEKHSDLLYEAYTQLNEYFAGKRMKFDLPLKAKGTAFQQRVWQELLKIPYGETRSYEDIAVGIGNRRAVRAVGQANGRNPIMIIVPCHRVIHKSGSIDGFACGTEIKRFLLDLEKGKG